MSCHAAPRPVEPPSESDADDVKFNHSLFLFVVPANETEVAFFRKEDYGLYKANPKSAWWPQDFN